MSLRTRQDLVLIIGCPRSGTTWLQLMLAYHPRVATVNETHIFSKFLGPALESWDDLSDSPRSIGLGSLYSREEFLEHLRSVVRDAVQRIARTNESEARVVVEKTPGHAVWGQRVLEVVPSVQLVHLVRDPRDVASSLIAASSDWGGSWAPGNAHDAAWMWREYVEAGRALRKETERYRELRYEDLLISTRKELASLLEWIGVEVSGEVPEEPEEVIDGAVRETRLSRMRQGEADAPWELDEEPDGFVREGGASNWREELSRGEAHVVEHVCRDLMTELDYATSRSVPYPPLRLLPFWVRDRVRWRIC